MSFNSESKVSAIEQIYSICSKCRNVTIMPFGHGNCTCGGIYNPITEFEFHDETNKKLNEILKRLDTPWYRRLFH